jgi:hypothetical protein
MTDQEASMRKLLKPARVAASVAIALASSAALAQLQIAPANTGNAPAGSSTAATPTTAPGIAAGGCVGTGGSTCVAATTTTTDTSTGTTGATDPATLAPPTATTTPGSPSVASTPGSTSPSPTATAAESGATVSRPFTPDFVNNEAATAPFRITPNTPDATPTGAALGRSVGQSSSGTAAGNSSPGLAVGSDTLGTVNPEAPGAGLGTATVLPGVGFGATTIAADTGAGINASGERIGMADARSAVAAGNGASTPTPLFELTARQGAAREARRRARGEEPRIIGIAPRTDRDLTHEMPDDPIIRY